MAFLESLDHTSHHISNFTFEIEGDVAHCESYVITTLLPKGSETATIGGARYIDRFERRNGEWRIAHREAVMDFTFLAATMGSVVGEKITRAIELATKKKMPVIIVCASGGARMYEGMLSLMQMAKTSGALARHAQAKLPYITVLTNPTTAGVMASFASLGDVILAEPKSMIGFAGPRVIKETTHQDLPPGFQTAEFLEKHGLVDHIVSRAKLRDLLAQLLGYFAAGKK